MEVDDGGGCGESAREARMNELTLDQIKQDILRENEYPNQALYQRLTNERLLAIIRVIEEDRQRAVAKEYKLVEIV